MPPPTPTSMAASAIPRGRKVNAEGQPRRPRGESVGAYLIAVGTDFVFPGDGGAPYAEEASPRPLSVYGRSKLAGEEAVPPSGSLPAPLGSMGARENTSPGRC